MQRAVADRRRLLEAHGRRLVRQRAALPNADVLGVRAVPRRPKTSSPTANSVTARADRLDVAGELHAEDPVASAAGGR